MKLEFVNHSSVVIDTRGVRIICDPWLDGAIFHNAWDLLARTRFGYDDFRDITHIWFSHEHPDHFFPPNIKKIPAEYRQRITVLFQRTADKKVVDFCTRIGFREVVELSPDEWSEVAPDVNVLCRPLAANWGDGDSWLCVKSEGRTILNINDCEVYQPESARAVGRRVGAVDVLLTQFSYACWVGGVEEQYRKAAEQLRYVAMQIEVLKPTFVVPFASFVWFCHEENRVLNEGVNKIGEVASFIRANTAAKPVIMYPGDTWDLSEEYRNSEVAIRAWQKEYDEVPSRARVQGSPVSPERLFESSQKYLEKRRKRVGPLVAHIHSAVVAHPLRSGNGSLRPGVFSWLARCLLLKATSSRLWVTDHGTGYELDWRGLRRIDIPHERCDIELYSDALLFCFDFPFGGETLAINGRFRALRPGGHRPFLSLFKFERLVDHGHHSPFFAEARKLLRHLLRVARSSRRK